jgi:lysine decarboxylase
VPGHKGGPGADSELREAIGDNALALDIPALIEGIDMGPEPTPWQQAQELAAEAWGARRTWFLLNGASQGNHVACLALVHLGDEIVMQRTAHSSAVDGLVISGLRPRFVQPELDPALRIAHCVTPEALDAALADTPAAVGAHVTSPTYFGAVADVRGLVDVAHAHDVPLVVDEAWGAHLAFHPDLPLHALAAGADVVISSTHKIVGSLTQSAMVHVAGDLLEDHLVDRAVTLTESTSPNSLLCGSLDAARRLAATRGRELLSETIEALAAAREAIREVPGLDVLDESIAGTPGVHDYDPLRLAIDVRGTGATGYELAAAVAEDDIIFELYGENVVVAIFGMAEHVGPQVERLVGALRRAVNRLVSKEGQTPFRNRHHEPFAPPPPWGELAMTPREAFLGPQEAVPFAEAGGRIAAESLAAYPPGVPNVLPGERLTAPTIEYVQATLEHGGMLRGAADRRLRTIRVVIES